MWTRAIFRSFLVFTAALTLVGCQRGQPTSPGVNLPSGAVELRAEGDARRSRGDFAGALEAYQAALEKTPDDVHIRYLVGVMLTHLDRRDETTAAFKWVVEHGKPGDEEVALARQWLLEAGALPRAAAARPAPGPATPTTGAASTGQVRGKTEWKKLEPNGPVLRLQLVLVSTDQATQGRKYSTIVPLNEPYQLSGVAPGNYRLIGQVAMTRLWDMPVAVQDGKPTVLDLTEANTLAKPDALRAPTS